jgi:hypothetical protein
MAIRTMCPRIRPRSCARGAPSRDNPPDAETVITRNHWGVAALQRQTRPSDVKTTCQSLQPALVELAGQASLPQHPESLYHSWDRLYRSHHWRIFEFSLSGRMRTLLYRHVLWRGAHSSAARIGAMPSGPYATAAVAGAAPVTPAQGFISVYKVACHRYVSPECLTLPAGHQGR